MNSELNKGNRKSEEINDNVFLELYPGLIRYCNFLSKNKWDGEDIAHETMEKALKNYRNHNSINAALLNKMAYHHWIDMIRKRKFEAIEEAPTKISMKESSLYETVEQLTEQLTPKQAVIFMLKEAFQYKTNEIAELLSTSETAIKSILHRTKKRLSESKAYDVAYYWTDEDREMLFKLFYDSLIAQDPALLISALPNISSLSSEALESKLTRLPTKSSVFTPSSIFSMAA